MSSPVLCPKHGLRGSIFVCPHISKAIGTGSRCPKIQFLVYSLKDEPELEGYEFGCWYCPKCIAEYCLPATGSAITEEFLVRLGDKQRPMCSRCFEEWKAIEN